MKNRVKVGFLKGREPLYKLTFVDFDFFVRFSLYGMILLKKGSLPDRWAVFFGFCSLPGVKGVGRGYFPVSQSVSVSGKAGKAQSV